MYTMQRKLSRKAKNDYGKAIVNPDVRPLDQREKKLDTRKGMVKHSETTINSIQVKLYDFFK